MTEKTSKRKAKENCIMSKRRRFQNESRVKYPREVEQDGIDISYWFSRKLMIVILLD